MFWLQAARDPKTQMSPNATTLAECQNLGPIRNHVFVYGPVLKSSTSSALSAKTEKTYEHTCAPASVCASLQVPKCQNRAVAASTNNHVIKTLLRNTIRYHISRTYMTIHNSLTHIFNSLRP